MDYSKILDFWFHQLQAEDHFKKDEKLDIQIKDQFSHYLVASIKGELFHWRNEAEGRLAEIILLDQFSRNIYRDTAQAFAQDSLALFLSQELIFLKWDLKLNLNQRAFAYMPFMHSESQKIHEEAVKLFSQNGLESYLQYELMHKKIIDRFKRYPHRNEILKRKSSDEELMFLKEENSSF